MDAPVSALDRFLSVFFNAQIMREYAPLVAQGMLVTLQLAALVVISGILIGLALACIRICRVRALNALIVLYADLLRSLPPLVLILLVYFGLPNIGIDLPGFVTVWLVLSLVLGAFAEEIFWAGLLSVHKGQWQAARATGFGFGATLWHIVLPQAIRLTIPPLTNRAIAISKNTALGSAVSVPEILYQATSAQSVTGSATPLLLGTLAYLLLFVPVVILGRWLEQRFAWGTR
ncbi:amino acid ABC transporter permease [Brenneria izadpanahii]|uniref:Amino acid ABC transporter permease n=1 Tax=Brenneria izadpanahii TaxID=2722756 RepID=A0ABX7UUZ0_9GAMM|nr:amino acid ABC transporter permease [Brenneria izadpanahii]QTF08671.1 amino acid ABC transporter permease [Brenneria izadpanahii]